MSFLDRVREKLLEPNRIRRVERFQGNDAQKVFAGMEILAEDLAVFREKLDKLEHRMDAFVIEMSVPVEMHLTDKTGIVYDIKDEQIPFSEPPLDELPAPDIGRVNKPCEECGGMMLNVFPATKRCPACKGAKK